MILWVLGTMPVLEETGEEESVASQAAGGKTVQEPLPMARCTKEEPKEKENIGLQQRHPMRLKSPGPSRVGANGFQRASNASVHRCLLTQKLAVRPPADWQKGKC